MVISRVERYAVLKGCYLRSVDDFKLKYHSPCEPDVFISWVDKKLGLQMCVIEIETHATKQSRETKWHQYKECTAGIHHLVILELDDLIAQNNWRAIDKFIEERMPI
jgi:hypothetical protein